MNDAQLVESLECAVIVINPERLIQRVNISAETLFGHSRRYLVNLPFSELVADDKVEQCINQCFQNNSQFTLREVEIPQEEKPILVDITMSPANTEMLEPQLLIEVNVINRISRFMKEKNQLERQQAFRLMMRGLAHEIKNPLGGIRGAAQLLDKELTGRAQRELTGILIKEADRLTRLVDRVMGSRDQLKLGYLNVHEVLEHVVHLVTVKSATPIRVERSYDPTLPELNADKEQLIQATLNIVTNAIEAQEDSESIAIGFVTEFDRFITINQVMFRQVLKIRIWDSGPGVSPDLLETLFDPLITGRPQGSGLGLSITQEIIQRHKGTVKLEKYEGRTCFSIYLPYINGSLNSEQDLI